MIQPELLRVKPSICSGFKHQFVILKPKYVECRRVMCHYFRIVFYMVLLVYLSKLSNILIISSVFMQGEPTVSGCGELLTELLKRYGWADQGTKGPRRVDMGIFIQNGWLINHRIG